MSEKDAQSKFMDYILHELSQVKADLETAKEENQNLREKLVALSNSPQPPQGRYITDQALSALKSATAIQEQNTTTSENVRKVADLILRYKDKVGFQ